MISIIKTRSIAYNVQHLILDMFVFDEKYRKIRCSRRYKGFGCFKCAKSFEDGEKISLAFISTGNKVLCRECAVELKRQL